MCACVLAALMTGLYGTAVQLPEYNAFEDFQQMSTGVCVCGGVEDV